MPGPDWDYEANWEEHTADLDKLKKDLEDETGIRYNIYYHDNGYLVIHPETSEFGAGYALADGFSTWQSYMEFAFGALAWVGSPGFPSRFLSGKRAINIAFSLDDALSAIKRIKEMPDDPVVITDERPDGIFDYTYHNGMYTFEFVR
ncbi:MAG: hypothetical protein OXH22_00880 [Chloroflexi bacterium]|nr:hypothetical protein [Chloroflexota bacterium]